MARVAGIRAPAGVGALDTSFWVAWDVAPASTNHLLGATMPTQTRDKHGFLHNTIVTAINTPISVIYRNKPCVRMTAPVPVESREGFQYDGCHVIPLLLQGDLASGFVDPTAQIWRYFFMIARDAGTLINSGGIFFILHNDSRRRPGANFGPATTAVAFGLAGNGAGWGYFSKPQSGVSPIFEVPLAWPVPVTEWALVELRIEGATDTRSARFRILVNGSLLISRLWSGVELPLYPARFTSSGIAFAPSLTASEDTVNQILIYCGGTLFIRSGVSPVPA